MMAAFPFEFPPPDSRPVGYRFRPTEEELISHYLRNKMLGNESLVQSIPVVDLYNHEPHQLPELSTSKSDNHEWFFFQPESNTRLHRNTQTKRTTSTGYWKSTGVDRKIKARGTNDVIGTRKILVFHKGKTHGVRTRWILHEYRLQIQHHPYPYKSSYTVCRLKENAQHVSTCDQHEHNNSDSSRLKRKATGKEIQEVYSETHSANGASYSEPQLASINFQPANANAIDEINRQPDAIDNDDDFTLLNEIETFLLDPSTNMLESSFSSDDLTRWWKEGQSLPLGVEYVYHQGASNSVDRWWNEDESLPRGSGIYVLQSGSCSDDELKPFKAPKSNDLESYARRILLFIVNATRILLFIVKAISQYKAKEDEKRKKVVGPTSQISITDSSNVQKSEGGNKYGCIDSTTKHIQQEQDTTNVPSVDVVIAFLAIIMLVLSVRTLLQLLWERVLKMMQGRRARYLFVALLWCAAVWWKSGRGHAGISP